MSDGEFQLPNEDEAEIDAMKELEEEYKEWSIKDLVKNNFVYFNYYRQGHFYYNLVTEKGTFQFPIPLEDIGTATLEQRDKALSFMRWVRKAIEDKTFIRL